MLALMFKNVRSFTSKTGEQMIVVPMLLLESGQLIEQYFVKSEFDGWGLEDRLYFTGTNPAVVDLELQDKGFRKVVVGMEWAGKLDYKVK